MTNPLVLILFGVFVGVFSGIMGLGGGAMMIPILVLVLGLEQAKAHGVSLAVMIPPVTLPAVIRYFQGGKLTTADLWMAALIALGFGLGSYFGAKIAVTLPQGTLKLVFGFFLVYVAGYTIFSYFGSGHLARTVIFAGIVALTAVVLFGVAKWLDRPTAGAAEVTPSADRA